MPTHYPNGIGGSSGDSLVLRSPLDLVSGNIWYVSSSTGTDSASPQGMTRLAPVASLAQAQTNASDGDIVVLMSGHAETLTAVLNITKSLIIVGEGSSGGYPTVKFTNNQATTGKMLNITAPYGQLRNVWIEENLHATANSSIRVHIDAYDHYRMIGCYVQCGQRDSGVGVGFSGRAIAVEGCTFVCTAVTGQTPPNSGLAVDGASNTDILVIRNNILDGGASNTFSGYSGWHAIDCTAGGVSTVSNVWGEGNSFIRGAAYRPGTGSEYHVGGTFTGSVRLT